MQRKRLERRVYRMSNLRMMKLAYGDEDEINQVYNIIKLCGQEMYVKDGLEHWKKPYPIEAIRKNIMDSEVYVILSDDNVVGTVTVTNNKSIYFDDNIPAIYISKFAIHPEYFGQGIGSEMIKWLEKLAVKRNIKTIRLDVYVKSEKAIVFYQHRGFEIMDEKPTRNFSVYCMEKKL